MQAEKIPASGVESHANDEPENPKANAPVSFHRDTSVRRGEEASTWFTGEMEYGLCADQRRVQICELTTYLWFVVVLSGALTCKFESVLYGEQRTSLPPK